MVIWCWYHLFEWGKVSLEEQGRFNMRDRLGIQQRPRKGENKQQKRLDVNEHMLLTPQLLEGGGAVVGLSWLFERAASFTTWCGKLKSFTNPGGLEATV